MIIRSRAPLRLGLAGGGTDVPPFCDLHGGAVLNATIDLYAYCTIEITKDSKVKFVATDTNTSAEFDCRSELPSPSPLPLHAATYNRIVKTFNQGHPMSLKITTFCDAPPGSGLGSSSTLVVAMVQAFSDLLSLPLGEYEIAQLAYVIERCDSRLRGGKQDQYAAAFGGFNFMEFNGSDDVLVNPLRIKQWIISELETSLVLFYTGSSRDSAAIIEEESLNVQQNNEGAINAMLESKVQAVKMKECLLRGEVRKLAAVMQSAWEAKKRMASKISNERIERYYDLACNSGAYCGKVSGAGGGGFMMFLVDPTKKLKVLEALRGEPGGVVLGCHFTGDGSESWRVE